MTTTEYFAKRPVYGGLASKRSEPKFLLVAFFDPNGISTVSEYVANWQRYSQFDIQPVNLWPNRRAGYLSLPDNIDLNDYDGVILHTTVTYFPANMLNLDALLHTKFANYPGIKILVKQDEHYHSSKVAGFIAVNDFDVLVTCVPPSEVQKVYPRSVVGNIAVVHALTGFVTPEMRNIRAPDYRSRTIDISYRGSVQPLSFGRLGFEKRKIGFDVSKAEGCAGLSTDISSRWEDRIGGDGWFDFLANSKVVLGVESGSNLFDFDGSVETWCKRYTDIHRDEPEDSEDFYLRAHDAFLHKFEGNVDYAQISPRHFEAAATRSVQLLYEGRYSGIFEPGRHYVALKRDLSNLDEALDVLNDPARAKQLTDAAFEEIVLNREYSYETFVRKVDEVLHQQLELHKRHHTARSSNELQAPAGNEIAPEPRRPRALVLMAHEPTIDPRIDWVSKGFIAHDFDVLELGISKAQGQPPSFERVADNHLRVRLGRELHALDVVSNPALMPDGSLLPEHVAVSLHMFSLMPAELLAERIGALDASAQELATFKWYCKYLYDTNASLVRAARLIGKFDVVVGTDLDTLVGALIIARESAAVCVYDAHEYWKGVAAQTPWAYEFWGHVEHGLVQLADICSTVSPPLARQLEIEYGKPFLSVQNCELASVASTTPDQALDHPVKRDGQVAFLFQGTFHPERPVATLIEAWKDTDQNAVLWLRGPHWEERDRLLELAQGTGLLGTRIFFPDAVKEAHLVPAAAQADVGIVPYDPAVNLGYRFACPNKLSQYLAAGLTILTSNLEYVAKTVTENQLGEVFDIKDPGMFVDKVNKLTGDAKYRRTCSRNARRYFSEEFNWEKVSKPLFEKILDATSKSDRRPSAELRFDWMDSDRLPNIVRSLMSSSTPSGTDVPRASMAQLMWLSIPLAARRRIKNRVPARVFDVLRRLT